MSRVAEFLAKFSAGAIPRRGFELSFNRSSGPGGQNVNKVNSKATIKYTRQQWAKADWLPPEVRERLASDTQHFPYATKRGDWIVSSELTRSQKANLDNCFDKLADAIKQSAWVPTEPSSETKKRWKDIRKAADKFRLQEKKRASVKKQSRTRLE